MFEELQLALIQSFMARLQKLPPRRDNQFAVSGNTLQFQIRGYDKEKKCDIVRSYQVNYDNKVFQLAEWKNGKFENAGSYKNEAKLVKYLEKQNLK